MPEPEMIEAQPWHYDGRNANRWQPCLLGDAQGFRLIGEGWESGPWQWADLVALDERGGERIFGHRSESGWRLGIPADAAPELLALLPRAARYGGFIDRFGLWRASAAMAVVAALLLFVGIKAPGWIAPYVPQSWEDSLGDAMVGDFGGRFCHTPEGTAALNALVRKMDPEGRARSVEVANIRMVNAIALPGRRVILFTDLVEQAKSPDEVAGVLGHELGHVRHRHTLSALMRQLGLSVILGGMDGSAGSNASALLGLSFTREAEHEADLAAIDALRAANVSPAGIAGFFGTDRRKESQSKDGKAQESMEAADWFASHPSVASRRALYEKAVVKGHPYQPALDKAQWEALKGMCASDRKVKPGWDFSL